MDCIVAWFILSPSVAPKPNITWQMPVVPSYLTATTMGEDAFDPRVYGQVSRTLPSGLAEGRTSG